MLFFTFYTILQNNASTSGVTTCAEVDHDGTGKEQRGRSQKKAYNKITQKNASLVEDFTRNIYT